MKKILRDKGLKEVLFITVVVKLTIFLIIILAYHLLPFCVSCRQVNFLYPANQKLSLGSAFKTWDGQHYLYVAKNGYSPDHMSNAFYPLYPFLIRGFNPIFNNFLITGLLLSNVLSLFGIMLFYKLVSLKSGKSVAFWSSLLLLSFPMSFYFSLVYGEALIFLLVVGFFYWLSIKKFGLAFLTALLLPLSRAQGVFLLVPYVVFVIEEIRKKGKAIKNIGKLLLPGWGFLLGAGGQLLIMKVSTGDFFASYSAYKKYVANYSLKLLFTPYKWFVGNFVNIKLKMHGFNNSLINRIFFVGFLGLMRSSLKLLDRPMLSYLVVAGVVPALSGYFMSYPRYLLLIFPLFIVMGKLFKDKWWVLGIPMFSVQIVFLIMHALNYWVA